MKKLLTVAIILVIVMTSSMVFAYEAGDPTNMMADTLVLRPLGFAALVAGSALYVVSLPAALITKSADKTFDTLVKKPYEYVFVRPVGELGSGL